jgi:isoamylase
MPRSKFEILPGVQPPLGASFDGAGVNFALYSEHATGVALCLFGGSDGNDEIARVPFTERTKHVWHAYLRGIKPGDRYGYRVTGVYDPAAGHCFNPAKLRSPTWSRTTSSTTRPTAKAIATARTTIARGIAASRARPIRPKF